MGKQRGFPEFWLQSRACVSSFSKNGCVLEYRLPQLGQSDLVTKPLAAGYLFDAVALPDVGRQHAVDQVAGRLAHSLAVRVGRTAGYWTSTVRNGEDI